VACSLSGPADGGKAKWATFKALRNGRKFWFSRGDRFKRTRSFWFLFGAMPKRTIKIGLLTFSAAPKINVLDRSDEKIFY